MAERPKTLKALHRARWVTFYKTNILALMHRLDCIFHLDTAQVHRFDDSEQIFTYSLVMWCIFFHTKAVDQRDVADQGVT